MSTPDPRTEAIRLAVRRYRGPSDHDECINDLRYLLAALTTEAARVRGVVQNLRNDVAEKFSQARISFCHDAYGAQLEILRELLSKLEQDAGPFSATNEKGQSTWSTARPTVATWTWWRKNAASEPIMLGLRISQNAMTDGMMFVMNKEGLQRYIDYWKGGEWRPIARPGEREEW